MAQLVRVGNTGRLGGAAGGLPIPSNAIRDRAAAVIRDRAGSIIVTRA